MKILLCFGTRPEAIKMAPVIHELKQQKLDFKVCVTAQHREMLDQVLGFFEIVPDYDLDLMQPNQSLNQLSSKILKYIDEILVKEKPSLVLAQGDTTSAAMVSLAAFHREIKVGHVEAGLRTYNKMAPFPEEVNRQITSRIADFHFAPTVKSKLNLLKEQIPKEHIYVTGNTVVDALEWAIAKMEAEQLSEEIQKIKALINPHKKMVLITGHRRENFGEGLIQICGALLELSERENVELIYPVHLNPNVNGPVQELLSHKNNIHLIDPVAYPSMLWLMQQCSLIISDSGGIQEEAPTFNKPVLVTREVSERMEGVEAGFSFLVGTDKDKIVEEAIRILNHPPDFLGIENPYGDGTAAKQIVHILLDAKNV
ncbi:non-hydrolyzing UDP-N-acetylglucosamine 2-epimerase [Gillisia hiemivivida]|uniref:UDP-N-acetylglucosamine 2-epimerase (non-hydrolyzing) n=1 Tax=Gillisia hiemivivida TaxID=291190 RepID=A0A5C6ZSU1_9FLAO|nr:UDP-N-acetylglucosamine 2-epimerase (non-hydrolyzing) [Gillisia hiemivivida]TXD93893.1 UDP-N-acetylglucosamine 2-epimerase (non-hydrolyzing) [Gillisia hiemivivida]